MKDFIRINGARENNLKNISLDIPKHKLVVVTGPSGSGKSTLAMDILQRECQRQYMESSGTSSESLPKPNVDSIVGLSPSISVGQHITNRNPRSTVGTVTDMYTYLRVIFEKKGARQCLICQHTIPAVASGGEEAIIYCPNCQHPHQPLTKADFSFNTPAGACPTCSGLGSVVDIDIEAVFDKEKSIREGAVTFWYDVMNEHYSQILEMASKHYQLNFDLTKPLKEYNEVEWDLVLHGVESEQFSRHYPDKPLPKTVGKGRFRGVLTSMWQRYKEKDGQIGEAVFFVSQPCRDCHGERLKEESRNVTVIDKTLPQLSVCSLEDLYHWLETVQQTYQNEGDSLLETILHDLLIKIKRVLNVGLGYLSLDRQSITLSGGESQRLRLASILGSGLTGVLYLLDEPTSGLHPKDTDGLIHVMKELRDLGNTVLLIEHDERVIQAADHLIDIGPGAGRFGGEVVGQGTMDELMQQDASITGRYLKQEKTYPTKRRQGIVESIIIHEATKHNLKKVTTSFPLGCLIAVSGVSGSGKSTLVFDLLGQTEGVNKKVTGCKEISGLEHINKMITVDQSPLSRMQRSSVSTYIDLYTLLRKTFAALPEAKEAGLTAKHFSFNTPGGRCDRCEGLGEVEVDMHFLSHLKVTCPDCQGKRFKDKVLAIQYEGYSISDILELSIEESLSLFKSQKKMVGLLTLLEEVGLGYLQWGQSVTTLSGGEGQRLKLAKELSNPSSGHTLYLLDEPSTGLHPIDVQKLYVLLNKLVDAGHTVVIVEHNADLITGADWVIDMGPEGGKDGGQVIVTGTPEDVAKESRSHTAPFLFS
ncbi:excinuclease ABC subunit UvrA [Alkalihalobacillus sp. 1P02AB]|uniref:excinuclease ABC subunit UvrA n=1 Tax=Alkalihalobacillus sp. 1P02AB TaxID=3132260 RepID=UPI0039A62455